MTEGPHEKAPNNNIFRDSFLRFAGYANEVGESFRYQFPRFVLPSYIVSFGYCLADAGSTGYSTYVNYFDSEIKRDDTTGMQNALRATVDTLLWQALASVILPGATINLVVRASHLVVRRTTIGSTLWAKWFPTATGLASIPFIVKPIDLAVDMLLDNSTRIWWKPMVTRRRTGRPEKQVLKD